MSTYYIGADVHSRTTELAVEKGSKIVDHYTVPTTIPAIAQVLDSLGGTKYLALEEGPMAGWLYRNLRSHVERLVICDPRRNKLIASEGDKDDPIDADKLAILLRGGYLKEVYHSQEEGRVELKEWVGLYQDRVEDAVRQINKIRARCRMHGLLIPRAVLRDPQKRSDWLKTISAVALAGQLGLLWLGYDAAVQQVHLALQQLRRVSRPYPILRHWCQLPGIGLIRAVTIFAYLDTPWRFKKKNQLWKYNGIGLQHSTSGTDARGRAKPARLHLPRAANHRLKNAILGAALSAIHQSENVFRQDYERMVQKGVIPSNARHAVARKMLTVMWGMWKTDRPWNPGLSDDDGVEAAFGEDPVIAMA